MGAWSAEKPPLPLSLSFPTPKETKKSIGVTSLRGRQRRGPDHRTVIGFLSLLPRRLQFGYFCTTPRKGIVR